MHKLLPTYHTDILIQGMQGYAVGARVLGMLEASLAASKCED